MKRCPIPVLTSNGLFSGGDRKETERALVSFTYDYMICNDLLIENYDLIEYKQLLIYLSCQYPNYLFSLVFW